MLREKIDSTTAQSSVPCEGMLSLSVSSAWKTPVGAPWYLSSIASRSKDDCAAERLPLMRNTTAPDLRLCALFTPCAE